MELVISIATNVILGLILLALLRWKTTRDEVRIASAEEALTLFRKHFPDVSGIATVCADQRAAVIELRPGPEVGLLQRQGRRWNAQILRPGDCKRVRRTADGTLTLDLANFGWPRAELRFADASTLEKWLNRFQSLTVRDASGQYGDSQRA
ncbi:MAG TPA: hypothetical protein VMT29_23505 [Steroidobacteraceae bacterium]|nr:hypothetical protein [Steroidobacteraceae bacterium]